MYLNDIFTVTVNMAGLPGIAVPAGKDAQGLPLGLQLIGRPFDEETLFSLGEVVEQAAGRFTPPRWWYMADFRASLSRTLRRRRAWNRRWLRCGGPPRATGTRRTRSCRTRATRTAAWVHAYLHRVEGDLGNAGYWYRQAGQPVAKDSLEAEWERIVSALLGSGKA